MLCRVDISLPLREEMQSLIRRQYLPVVIICCQCRGTPSEQAWTKGKELVENTLAQYRKTHGDYPRKVSYTFWSSEFIESEGATIAQVLYMLGVEPVRDAYGRVSDLRLILRKLWDVPVSTWWFRPPANSGI